jgi:hypothetical protein
MVGAFEYNGRLIGTMRAVPIGRGLAPCEAILNRRPPMPDDVLAGAWEIGRLVFAPDCRSGYDSLKSCMQMAFLYLVANADFRNGFALCNPPLARLYRRFGFNLLQKDVATTEAGSFSLIHGPVPAVLDALAGDPLDGEATP